MTTSTIFSARPFLGCGLLASLTLLAPLPAAMAPFGPAAAHGQVRLPDGPTDAAAVADAAGAVHFTWQDNADNEAGYRIIRERWDGSRWVDISGISVGANNTEYINTPGPGKWGYRVRAWNRYGNSSYTTRVVVNVMAPPASAPPTAPNELKVRVKDGGLMLMWNDNSFGEIGFEIERYPEFTDGLKRIIADETTFIDNNADNNAIYRIRAFSPAGESEFSPWMGVGGQAADPYGGSGGGTGGTGGTGGGTGGSGGTGGGTGGGGTGGGSGGGWGGWGGGGTGGSGGSVTGTNGGYGVTATWNPYQNLHDFTGLPMTEDGWTDMLAMYQHPSYYNDARIIYVSSSSGNDATATVYLPGNAAIGADPFSPSGAIMPFKTIHAAYQQLRHGYPDIMLLKRGDVWMEPLYGGGNKWDKSGRSANERMIVATYGESVDRPVIVPSVPMIRTSGGGGAPPEISYVIFSGMHGYRADHDPDSPIYNPAVGSAGLVSLGRPGTDVLFEDVHYSFGQINVQDDFLHKVAFRRCIVEKHYETDGTNAQGMFVNGPQSFLVDECLFYRNGWHPVVIGSTPDTHKHNMYMSEGGTIEIRNTITAEAASHGFQLRADVAQGRAINNLIIRNPIAGLLSGGGGALIDNVVLDGVNMPRGDSRGWGLDVQAANLTEVRGNIVAHKSTTVGTGHAFAMLTGAMFSSTPGLTQSIAFEQNIVYNWPGLALAIQSNDSYVNQIVLTGNTLYQPAAISELVNRPIPIDTSKFIFADNRYHSNGYGSQWFRVDGDWLDHGGWQAVANESNSTASPLAFVDPGRTIASYHASLGGAASYDAFMAKARQQSRRNWLPAYTATAVNSYIRAGFQVPNP